MKTWEEYLEQVQINESSYNQQMHDALMKKGIDLEKDDLDKVLDAIINIDKSWSQKKDPEGMAKHIAMDILDDVKTIHKGMK